MILSLISALVLSWASVPNFQSKPDAVTDWIRQIRKADFEGDRPKLEQLYQASEDFLEHNRNTAWIRYWRGFALWRKAANGFNDGATPEDQNSALTRAIDEFEKSLTADPKLTDSKIAEAGALMNLTFLNMQDQKKIKPLVPKFLKLVEEARKEAPNNPRFYWVYGPQLWYLPPTRGGGFDKAFDCYQKGLQLCKKQPKAKLIEADWGEPELQMNLAWSFLHLPEPKPLEAEKYAKMALKAVPNWHYLKDILLPQIIKAKS